MAKADRQRRRRRRFTEEFRLGAVRLVLDEGKTIGAVARELDLTASSLATWVRHAYAERTIRRDDRECIDTTVAHTNCPSCDASARL